MNFLLDTCVLSEGIKSPIDASVDRWLADTATSAQFASVVALAEVKAGIERLPAGRRKQHLADWFDLGLRPSLADRILEFDEPCAMTWAVLLARFPNAKFSDSQIAATALTYGLTLVTRNVRDFRFPGLAVFNPWTK